MNAGRLLALTQRHHLAFRGSNSNRCSRSNSGSIIGKVGGLQIGGRDQSSSSWKDWDSFRSSCCSCYSSRGKSHCTAKLVALRLYTSIFPILERGFAHSRWQPPCGRRNTLRTARIARAQNSQGTDDVVVGCLKVKHCCLLFVKKNIAQPSCSHTCTALPASPTTTHNRSLASNITNHLSCDIMSCFTINMRLSLNSPGALSDRQNNPRFPQT